MTVIWVEGIIGAGKTTLTHQIAETMGMRAILEPVNENPLLADYYHELEATGRAEKYGFAMQMWLMSQRYALQQLGAWEPRGAVLDRGLPGDRVFCRMLVDNGSIDERMWRVYESFYNVMTHGLPTPNILIYLHTTPETAMRRIRERGRDCERRITADYLRALAAGYETMIADVESGAHAWSRGIKVLRVDWNEDFVNVDEAIISHLYCVKKRPPYGLVAVS